MSGYSYPFVSLIVPIRNEQQYIEKNLKSLLTQNYPHHLMEILVADGLSTDATCPIITDVAVRHPDIPIQIIENPQKAMPAGFNLALRRAKGSVIFMIGGHSEFANDYVQRCVEILERTDADCVGGPIITVGETVVAKAIAMAQSSFFGVGGVAFRSEYAKAGYVDTVAFGAYRRTVFERIGNLDEELVRNQDDEFNFRLTQAGGKIWLEPTVRSTYYSRAGLGKLWRQYFQYGLYKVRVIQKRNAVPSWRHLVPAIFVLGLIVTILLSVFTHKPFWLLIVIPYAVANICASLWVARQEWPNLPFLPLAYGILHLAYGIGFIWGIWHWRRYGFPRLGLNVQTNDTGV